MSWKSDALKHAKAYSPKESCGLIVVIKGRKKYWGAKNLSVDESNFILDPADFAAAEDAGTVIGIVHSHPTTPPYPSAADRVSCQQSGLPWHIVNPHLEEWYTLNPEDYTPDLIGREWVWNSLDCWSLVRSWYKEQGVELPDYKRPTTPEEFDESPLFDTYWADAGFYRIADDEPLQVGDALLMSIGSDKLNHVGVVIENNMMLHHLRGRLSSADIYGEWLQNNTGKRLRLYNWQELSFYSV